MRQAVIVLGMHRSGTSAASGMFFLNGYDLGKSIMNANWSNPKGFYENKKIAELSDDLFRRLGVNWHNTLGLRNEWWEENTLDDFRERLKESILTEFGNDSKLLFKDPRMCILLPFYRKVFAEMEFDLRIVVIFRHPLEVAQSLNRRDGFSFRKSCRIWMDHMIRAERYSRGMKRVFIDYQSVIEDPVQAFIRLAGCLNEPSDLTAEQEARLIDFITPVLNHSDSGKRAETDMRNDAYLLFEIFKSAEYQDHTGTSEHQAEIISETFYQEVRGRRYPKISIITIVNQESTDLERTVRSVVTSDYPDLEYIIVACDAGPGHTAICRKYKYLASMIIIDSSRSFADARKEGLQIASGEWIGFLESGDSFIHQRSLSEFISELSLPEEGNRIEAGLITESSKFLLIKNALKAENDFFEQNGLIALE